MSRHVPRGVAVNATHLYWANQTTDSIGRASIGGGPGAPSFITNAGNASGGDPSGIAVSNTHVFWTTNSGANTGTIGRANLDGTAANTNFITGANFPNGIAVDAGHIYWANGGAIARANLDGSGVNLAFLPAAPNATGVAVDAGHIYWADNSTNMIGRANLDGSGADPDWIPNAGDPLYVAVDPPPTPPTPPPAADTTQPETVLDKGPGKKAEKGTAKFTFHSSEAGSTFECALKGKKASRKLREFTPCGSPKSFKKLKPGTYVFNVRAVDAARNVDPTPAKNRFKVGD